MTRVSTVRRTTACARRRARLVAGTVARYGRCAPGAADGERSADLRRKIMCRLALVTLLAVGSACAGDPPPLTRDHAWIVVATGAPERSALEKAGFRIAPTTNRHDGQGTASITIEFLNGFLELIYPDSTVPVSPAQQAGAEKFRLKSRWRETGYSPIGI